MIQAVIFDLDGTVLDNEGDWERVFSEIARKNNFVTNDEWFHEPGIGIFNNWRKYVDAQKAQDLTTETVKSYETSFNLRDGLVELVEQLKERGWMTALCTGSSWNVVEKELEELGLQLAFDITTTGEEAVLQKPDPEIFLLTAQKLGLDPEECLVIEDAIAGVRAGVEAGCQVVGLVSEYAPAEMLKAAGAKWVVDKLGDMLGEIDS